MRIIAEVGSNWSTLADCLNSIALAKACGADAVKFQAFNHHALYGSGRGTGALGDGAIAMHGTLPIEWLPKLKAKSDACGIEFMCSAFSVELLNEIDKYVSTHKVASAELTHKRILERLREIGKPVILSTGASSMADIGTALTVLGDTPVTLLYCVAAYPANFVNFYHMNNLREAFGVDVGFSDHSTDALIIPCEAKRLGATVIEKHVNFVSANGPDAPHSLNSGMFKLMCFSLRGGIVTVGGIGEQDMYTTHNRRLMCIRDIKAGEKLIENLNFGIFRALKPELRALSPWAIDRVSGSIAKIDIRAGTGITPDCI